MKVIALKVFGDGKRNYEEGEITDMTKAMFEKINSTPNGILVKEVKEVEGQDQSNDKEE